MSLVETFHAEHKARLARMGGNPLPTRVRELPKPPEPVKPPAIRPINPEFYYSQMWFYDLIAFAPKPDAVTRPPLRKIARIVADSYGVSLQEMASQNRTKRIVEPRQVAMYLCRKLTLRSFPEIGMFFAGRDHTTVLHAVNKIERMRAFPEMARVVERLTSLVLAP